MPTQVRIISPRNSAQWDDLVAGLITGKLWGQEQTYFGCASNERADKVRRAIRTAAKRRGIGMKAFWKECPDAGACKLGGADCQYHVYFTPYTMDEARSYKEKAAATRGK